MSYLQVLILAVIQGFAELLPVSSSAHVIIAERLMRLDPSTPQMTFLLVMLHTGTMFAVIYYFWSKWQSIWQGKGGNISSSRLLFAKNLLVATVVTGVVGYGLKTLIEKLFLGGADKAEIEELFKNMPLMAASLAAVGVLIIWTGRKQAQGGQVNLTPKVAAIIGAVQGLCLPFRGFSRSGATISAGMLQHVAREEAEVFSFALAVILTPPVVFRELLRLLKATKAGSFATGSELDLDWLALMTPGLVGMVFSFIAGILALRWLSSWLEQGKWHYFGIYCLAAASLTLFAHFFVV